MFHIKQYTKKDGIATRVYSDGFVHRRHAEERFLAICALEVLDKGYVFMYADHFPTGHPIIRKVEMQNNDVQMIVELSDTDSPKWLEYNRGGLRNE